MNTQIGIQIIADQIQRILSFWERPLVRNQLFIILLTVVIAAIASRIISRRIDGWRQSRTGADAGQAPLSVRLAAFLQHLLFPVLGLIGLSIAILLFSRQRFTGLIDLAVEIFRWILYFRIVVALGYDLLDGAHWRRFHTRLLMPLFWLFIIGRSLSSFIYWQEIAAYVLGGTTENPVTLGVLAAGIMGLYFWSTFIIQFLSVAYDVLVARSDLRAGSIEAGLMLARYILLLTGIYLFLIGIGLDSTTVAAITGGLSVGIGFGLQSIISNFVSGIILLFEGSIRPGDTLTLDGSLVRVAKMGLRATTVDRLSDRVELIVPNSELFSSTVITLTGSNTAKRQHIGIGASYNDDPEAVINVLKEVAHQHSGLLPGKEVGCVLKEFAGSSINYDLVVWYDAAKISGGKIKFDLHRMIHKAFAEHGFEMPFEQRDLNLGSGWTGLTEGLSVKS